MDLRYRMSFTIRGNWRFSGSLAVKWKLAKLLASLASYFNLMMETGMLYIDVILLPLNYSLKLIALTLYNSKALKPFGLLL